MSQNSDPRGHSTERYRVVVERDVQIPMRDGTLLAMDVYLPDATGPFPVLLERTPYDKSTSMEMKMDSPTYFASRGYAVAIQDVRGCFGSEGDSDILVNDGWGERRDGYDTVEAIARFPWRQRARRTSPRNSFGKRAPISTASAFSGVALWSSRSSFTRR